MRSTSETIPIFAGKTATYGGALGAFVSGLTISEAGVVVGIVVAVLGLIFGQYWAWKKDRRETQEQEIKWALKYGPNWRELLKKAPK